MPTDMSSNPNSFWNGGMEENSALNGEVAWTSINSLALDLLWDTQEQTDLGRPSWRESKGRTLPPPFPRRTRRSTLEM